MTRPRPLHSGAERGARRSSASPREIEPLHRAAGREARRSAQIGPAMMRLVVLLGLLLASLPLWPAHASSRPQQRDRTKNAYDPEAVRILQEMADAYGRLTSLRMETEYASALMPVSPLLRPAAPPVATPDSPDSPPANPRGQKELLNTEKKLDRKLRLSFAAPNRLRLEVEEPDDSGRALVSIWDSDGKSFWTYNPEKNLFSREKAPKRLHDFARLAHMTSGSLEVLMLMGVNPFTQIEEQTEEARYAGRETVQGKSVDVVLLSADLGLQATETRLYVGVDDRLLYRLVSETTQKPRPVTKSGVGSPLDELAPPDPGAPGAADAPPLGPDEVQTLPGVLMKSRITCDNKIDTAPSFDPFSFAYSPPADAFYLTNPAEKGKPLTLKQRLAELAKTLRKQQPKRSPSKVYHF